jgi:MinD-like ATPase involved in chromosome partitioning or flagellar assembly/predicted acylesterase/phospholipase RssA
MMDLKKPGRIITFYSYKGGTGRSMALANVAWILASAGERVLVIDWDLEAPGLHRYWRPFLLDPDLRVSEGVIDFVTEYCLAALHQPDERTPKHPGQWADWIQGQADLARYTTSLEWDFPGLGKIDYVPAGRQSAEYPIRVNTFDWRRFYEQFQGARLIDALRERMAKEYDFVLVDSRTGVSDTSGICTLQLPDSLAVCFTLNNQSIEGLHSILSSVVRHAEQANRRIDIFPLPMRIELGEAERLEARRKSARQRLERFVPIEGATQRERYWKEVEVLYVPIYSYEETLAAFRESGGVGSLLGAYERIAYHLSGHKVAELRVRPSDEARSRVLASFADVTAKPADSSLATKAEDLYQSLPPQDQEELRRILVRLVKLVAPGLDEPFALEEPDLKPKVDIVLAARDAGLLQVHSGHSTGDLHASFELSDRSLLWSWPRMVEWLSRERTSASRLDAAPVFLSPATAKLKLEGGSAQVDASRKRLGMRLEHWGHLAPRFLETRPHRMLAIDGGGVRTVLSLEILHSIERQLSEKLRKGVGFVLSDYFDYIAGTGTGAIVAAGLARGMPVSFLASFYQETMLPEMFEQSTLLARVKSFYTADPLRAKLEDVFGKDTNLSPENLRCLLLLVMRNQTTDSPWPISSNPDSKYNDPARMDCNLRIPLWQLIRASTAAPVYFPPEVIQFDPNDPNKTFVMVDGGASVYNNPSFLLYRMATSPEYRLNWKASERDLLLISVGSGTSRSPGKIASNIVSNLSGLPGQIMMDALNDQDRNCRTVGRCTWGESLDPEAGTMVPDDHPSDDQGRRFLYARYTVDLSRQGLDALECADIDPEHVQKFDSVDHVEELVRIGKAVGQQVRMEHFGPFVE